MKSFDPQAMLAQAQKVKNDLARVQKDLEQRMVEGTAANGLVTVVMSGMQELQAIRIKKEAVDPDDVEMLEDLVTVAVKAAFEKAKALRDAETQRVTGTTGMF